MVKQSMICMYVMHRPSPSPTSHFPLPISHFLHHGRASPSGVGRCPRHNGISAELGLASSLAILPSTLALFSCPFLRASPRAYGLIFVSRGRRTRQNGRECKTRRDEMSIAAAVIAGGDGRAGCDVRAPETPVHLRLSGRRGTDSLAFLLGNPTDGLVWIPYQLIASYMIASGT